MRETTDLTETASIRIKDRLCMRSYGSKDRPLLSSVGPSPADCPEGISHSSTGLSSNSPTW